MANPCHLARHTYSCMYSSFVQYQTYSCFNLVLLRCKKSRNLFFFSLFFQHKIYNFFSNTYLTKSVRNVKFAFVYIIKHVKILLSKVTTLHFMYDIYIYIYIYKVGGTHTVVCTAHLYSTVLLRCKKSRNLFSIFIVFST